MKKIHIAVLLLLATSTLQSCRFFHFTGEGTQITYSSSNANSETLKGSKARLAQDYDLEDFEDLEINGACELTFVQAATPSLRIEAPDNLLEHVTVEQRNGLLIIGMDRKFKYQNATLEISLAGPTLREVELNGAAEVEIERLDVKDLSIEANGASEMNLSSITGDSVRLELNGASEIDIDALSCKSLRVQANGASEVNVSGRADEARVNVAGTGSVDLSKLDCARKDAKVSGFGRVKK